MVVDICTNEYLCFLEFRRDFYNLVVNSFRQKKDAQSLSALTLLSYVLSSMVLPANKSLYECRTYVEKYRCVANDLFFLPGCFSFVDGDFTFAGRFSDKFLKKQFATLLEVRRYIARSHVRVPSSVNSLVLESGSLIMPIKHKKLRKFVEKYLVPSSGVTALSALGIPYVGDTLYSEANESTIIYGERAKAIFKVRGLGVESAALFAQLFFEEYFSLVKFYMRKKYLKSNRGFEYLKYNSKHQPFASRKNTQYSRSRSLESRFQYLLPEISPFDFQNSVEIKKKIKLDRN